MIAPLPEAQRALSIDALRGLAVLGILLINIQYFAMGVDLTPPSPDETDRFVRAMVAILAESKFVSIFSLLFGAGIVLMDRAAERRGENWNLRYARRAAILLLMGLLHAYLLWFGDILFTYALIGFAVFWLRTLPAPALLAVGATVFLVGLAVTGWIIGLSGGDLFEPGVEFDAARDGFLSRVALYAIAAIINQTFLLIIFSSWFVSGLMLVGMGLCKTGFFEGAWRTRWYLLTIAAALAIALPAIALAYQTRPGNFEYSIAWGYANPGLAPVVSLGYASVIILACTRLTPNSAVGALAAVGRMALTNYLLQSVICVVIFYQFGQIGRHNDAVVLAIAIAILLAQLIISPLWLRAFRTGPMEWLWRTLTYMKPQPLLKRAPQP